MLNYTYSNKLKTGFKIEIQTNYGYCKELDSGLYIM